MTLFDNYPDDDPGKRVTTCCDRLADMPRVDQFLHVLGHSRVPFSRMQVAWLTEHEPDEIDALIGDAVAKGWIAEVAPEEYMDHPPDLYVGRLTKRR